MLESGEERPLPAELPGELPLGYHRVEGDGVSTLLVVAPSRCHLPEWLDGGGRAWGFAAQRYAARSRASWGFGDLGDGTIVYSSTDLLDNYDNKEMALYRAWLDQVKPGAIPNYFGLYAWSATRLFVEQAIKLGGKLTRASMVSALRGVKDWTGNGLHVPQQVGARTTYNCASFFQLTDGKWRKLTPYQCGGMIRNG